MAVQAPTADLTGAVLAAAAAPQPAEVGRDALAAFTQTLAATVAGHEATAVGIAAGVWAEHGCDERTAVVGRPERLDLLSATIVHGAAAIAGLDAASTNRFAPEPSPLAVVLSLGAAVEADGPSALRAFALGCEVQTRLAQALSDATATRWDLTAVCAPVGAAVTAGVLLGLPQPQLRAALAIASAQLLGHRVTAGSELATYLVGKGAANGVHAALLAQAGLTGPDDVLEHPRGFFAVLALGEADLGSVAEGFGERWRWGGASLPDDDVRTAAAARLAPVLGDRTDAVLDAVAALRSGGDVGSLVEAASTTEVAA